MRSPTDRRRRPARWKRALLQLGTALALLVLAEFALRAAGVHPTERDADPYVGFTGVQRLYVPDGDELVTAPARRTHFNLQRFPATKAPGTFRIFCLGGSTTYGRPYTDPTSFPGWLRALLPVAAPGRSFEVINAGGISYASYRVAVVMEELADYEPDLFVVYTGHNEFLEQRTYGELRDANPALLSLGGLFGRTALFTGLRRLLGGEPAAASASDPGRPLLPAEVATILDGSVGPEAYSRDDPGRASVLAHFRTSLERMVHLADGAGARLVFVTPASELRDCRPFRSEHGPAPGFVDALGRAAADAKLAAITPGDPSSLPDLDLLAADDPRHALTRWLRGEALLAARRVDEARTELTAARDEDIVPLRAGSDVIAVVREVAAAHDLPLLDWVARVDALAAALDGAPIPGAALFLDHVHMTPDAYRELALELLRLFADRGWIALDPAFDDAAVGRVTASVEAGLDEEAHVRALSRLAAVLDWAGKREEAEALTAKALGLSAGGDAMSLWQQGNYQRERGDLEQAVASYRAALAVDPDYLEALFNLGEALLSLGRAEEAREPLTAALELDPTHAPSHLALGVVLEQLGDASAARNSYRRAIRYQPDMVDAHNRLGVSYLVAGDAPRAEEALRAAVLVDPTSARAQHNLGVLLAETNRVGEALAHFEQALAVDPDRASTHHKLGMALVILGRNEEGIAHLEQALALQPGDPRITRDLEQARIKASFAR